MRLFSKLINGVSGVAQKLLNYFNATTTSRFLILPAAEVFPVILILIWMNQWLIWMISLNVLYYHMNHLSNIATNFLMFPNNYCYILLSYIWASRHLNLLHYLFEYCLFHLYSKWMVHSFQILLLYIFHLIALHYHHLLLH